MTTRSVPYIPAPTVEERETYLNISGKIRSWLLTRDHKRIGIMYLVLTSIAFALGGSPDPAPAAPPQVPFAPGISPGFAPDAPPTIEAPR